MISKKNFVIALSVLSLGLSGCQETEADLIGDAQLCMDKATSATVSSCLDKIEGIESEQANVLRCSAGFIEEGFDQADRLIASLEELDAGGNGTSGLMSLIAFTSRSGSTANKALAAATNSYCQKSGQKSLSLLGTLATSATTLASLTVGGAGLEPGANIDADKIKDAIDAIMLSPSTHQQELEDIGTAVVSTYQIACSSGSTANADLCSEITDAINTTGVTLSDPKSVADAILQLWKDSTGS